MLRRPPVAASLIAGVVAVLCAVLVSACGQGAASGGADPAAAVPPGVPFYVEATLRPSGSERDDALAAAGKILHTPDPAARIQALLEQASASASSSSGAKVSFARDIEPWLGDKAGLWVTAPVRSGAQPGVGVVVDVRDADLARKKLDGFARADGKQVVSRSVGSHSYEVTSDGTAFAVDGDYALIGTEGEVRRGLTTLDGDGLASSDAYRNAIKPLTSSRLGLYYLDVKSLVDAAMRANPSASSQFGPLQGFMTSALAGGAQAGSFSADGDRLVVESVSHAGGMSGVLGAMTGLQSSPLLAELPGNAWAALAAPRVGAALRTAFGSLAGALGGAAVTQSLQRDYGIDLEQDVFSWIGDAGGFVRGTTPATVDGAVVLTVTDRARAATAFGKFVGLARVRGGVDPQPVHVPGADAAFSFRAPGSGRPVVMARGHDRVVVALGLDAAAEGLSASATLGDAPSYAAATKALGDGIAPSILVAMDPVLALVEASGTSASDPQYAKAKPYLQAFDVIASGTKRDGDVVRSRVAAGLK